MAAVMHKRSSPFALNTVDDYKASMEEVFGVPYDELPEDIRFSDNRITELFLTGYRE